MTRHHEHLIGYLLGANEAHEDQLVKDQLSREPELHDQLAILRQHVEHLDDGLDEELPPTDLTARTCQLLDNPSTWPSLWSQITDTTVSQDENAPGVSLNRVKLSNRREAVSGGSSRFSLMDGLVALGVCLAALVIFFPALASSRMLASRIQCEDNLRQVGMGLHKFADASSRQQYPEIHGAGPLSVAGSYAPRLVNEGFISNPEVLSCVATSKQISLPTIEELLVAPEVMLPELHDRLEGVFNYNLGSRHGDNIEAPRMAGRARFPIASDVVLVNDTLIGSDSHFENRVNILFDDGHVEFLKIEHLPSDIQRVFVNNEGLVQAGIDEDDVVLANSIARPIPGAPLHIALSD
ncbi:MAG: hypothetical protein WD045_10725 [Pirellulaceae bacterium]